MGFRFSTIG